MGNTVGRLYNFLAFFLMQTTTNVRLCLARTEERATIILTITFVIVLQALPEIIARQVRVC